MADVISGAGVGGAARVELTAQQLAGLARLGDLVHGLTAAPAGAQGALGEALVRGGDWYARYDLPALAESTLGALDALHRAGLLDAVRDNAAFVAESLATLTPMLGQWTEAAKNIPWQRLQQHARTADRLLTQLEAISTFIDQHLAGKLVELGVEMGQLWADTEADTSLREALETLAVLRRNGTLRRLRDASDQLDALLKSVNLDALASDFVQVGGDGKGGMVEVVALLLNLLRALDQAARSAPTAKGGLGGLLKLLRDPEVQQGMEVIARLPAALQGAGAKAKTPG